MAACLRAKCAAGGHDLPKFRMCYGPEYVSAALQTWAAKRGIWLLYIQPGKPQHCEPARQRFECGEQAYIERYNRTVRQEWVSVRPNCP